MWGMTTPSVVLVGNDKGGDISAFRLVDDELQLLANTTVGVGCGTFAVDAAKSLVYVAVKEPHPAVVALRLDRATGALAEVSRHGVDDPLAYLALSGNVLLGASYRGGWGASWPVLDGVLGEAASRLEYRNLHAVVTDPQGRHAYFASLGEDLIAQFSIEAGGRLTALPEPVVACQPGSGPRHLVVSTDGTSVYLLTEFSAEAVRFDRASHGGLTKAESVPAHDVHKGLGRSAYGRNPRDEHLIWGADLALVDDEGWLVCSERTSSTIAAVALDGGHLSTRVVVTPTEEQPRGLAVSPDGSRVVVVGERSGCASLYRMDAGALVQLHRVETGLGPNWVRFV